MNIGNKKRKYSCKNDPNKFCYVCAQYIFVKPTNFATKLQSAYSFYFNLTPLNVSETWTPSVLCNTCKTLLNMWMSGAK